MDGGRPINGDAAARAASGVTEDGRTLVGMVRSCDAHEFARAEAAAGSASAVASLRRDVEGAMRVARRARDKLLEPKPLVGLGAMTLAVLGIGVAEGALLVRRRPRDVAFVLRYAAAQVIPSVIWYTKPVAQVATAAGRDPARLLRVIDSTTPAGARVALRVQQLATARSIIMGFSGIAYVLRFVGIGGEAVDEVEAAIRSGKEPMLHGTPERVVRLAGTDSDVTWLSMQLYGPHILPVVEDPTAWPVARRVPHYSKNFTRPCMWTVPSNKYGKRDSWTGFVVDRDWLLTTESGRRVLLVEADSSVGEQALALGHESANDLSLQEASQGFRMVRRIAAESGALKLGGEAGDRVVRVLLADPSQTLRTGGGYELSLRSVVETQGEADILIDAKLPLVEEILLWAEASESPDARGVLCFDTNNAEYYATLHRVLKGHGWQVVDRASPRALKNPRLPRLVYQDSTQDTLNTIESLLTHGLVDAGRTCALLDSHDGLQDLRDLSARLSADISVVCSATVYNALFAEVRRLVRADVDNRSIQRHMDALVRVGTRDRSETNRLLRK